MGNKFNCAYDVDNHSWKDGENKAFIRDLVSNLLDISFEEDNNKSCYITEMSEDKRDMVVKLGNHLYEKENKQSEVTTE